MNIHLDDDAVDSQSRPVAESRPMYWSIRRELWENRSIYIVPLLVSGVVLFATMINTIGLARRIGAVPATDLAKRYSVIATPFKMAPAPIMMAALFVGFFFALDALYGERRDRSILFWKSLPVSDRTTVFAKFSIPFVVLPVIAFVLSAIVQVIMLFVSSAALASHGLSPSILWNEVRFFEGLPVMIYGLAIHALWFAPIYAYLLLVSVWARRTPLLWVVIPPLTIGAVEWIVFRTSYFGQFLKYRVAGAMAEGFMAVGKPNGSVDGLEELNIGGFLAAPGLWFGLLFAAAFLAATVSLRRMREPI